MCSVVASSARIDAELLAQPRGLERELDVRTEQQVVEQLDRLPRAERAEVHDVARVGVEHRSAPLDVGVVAPDEHGERPVGDLRGPAAAGRVDHAHPASRRPGPRMAPTVRGLPVVVTTTTDPGAIASASPCSSTTSRTCSSL